MSTITLSPHANIAIIRLSALGDVCHAISVVSAVQKRYPQAKITWITGKQEAHLVNMMPNVNVIVYDKKTGIKGMLALKKLLNHQHFDALLHMQWSIRASLLSRMLRAKIRIGFCRSHSREKQHWFVNHLAPEPKGFHVLDALMSMAEAVDAAVDTPFWSLNPLMTKEFEQLNLPSSYIILNPSASDPIRNWTLNGYRQVVAFLLEQGENVILTGGPASQEVEFARQVAQDFNVINLVGKTSLPLLTEVIQKAKLIISPDTGPAHIGTMVSTPVLALCALSNPLRTGPYLSQSLTVSVYQELAEKEYQQSIKDIPWAARVHDDKAMEFIHADAVIAKLQGFLPTK